MDSINIAFFYFLTSSPSFDIPVYGIKILMTILIPAAREAGSDECPAAVVRSDRLGGGDG
jgi:hypothetical protein